MQITVRATAMDIEDLRTLIEKLSEIEKEHSGNCTLSVEIILG